MTWQLASVLLGLFALIAFVYWQEIGRISREEMREWIKEAVAETLDVGDHEFDEEHQSKGS